MHFLIYNGFKTLSTAFIDLFRRAQRLSLYETSDFNEINYTTLI